MLPKFTRTIEDIKVMDEDGVESAWDFETIGDAQDYLLERLHCAGKIYVTYKDTYTRTVQYKNKESVPPEFYKAIREAIDIGCKGRTFYEGYFSNPDNLSRVDQMLKILYEAIGEET